MKMIQESPNSEVLREFIGLQCLRTQASMLPNLMFFIVNDVLLHFQKLALYLFAIQRYPQYFYGITKCFYASQ